MHRRKPVPLVVPTEPPRAPKTPAGIGGVFVPPPLRTPAELEAQAVGRDLHARAQLAEVLRPFGRAKLVLWALAELVDAPTAPDPTPAADPHVAGGRGGYVERIEPAAEPGYVLVHVVTGDGRRLTWHVPEGPLPTAPTTAKEIP